MLRKIDRLTERYKNGIADAVWRDKSYPCHRMDICPEGDCDIRNYCDYANILERLAAYEDTRLTPKDVAMMVKEKKELEEQVDKLKKENRRLKNV